MSVLFAVVDEEGCADAAAPELAPKEPPLARDSAARESEVISPAFSNLGFLRASGSFETLTLCQSMIVSWLSK